MVNVRLEKGDCVEVLNSLDASSVDSIVTDPPYEIGFMGSSWDSTGVAFNPATWEAALRVLKPGGHLLAFSSARTYHRLACAIEDAGFEIRDQIMWVYGCLSDDTLLVTPSGPCSRHDVSVGDLVLCYDPPTRSYSWQPIQEKYEYEIADIVYRIRADNTDQLVSRHHRCIVERGGVEAFVPAEEAAQEPQIRVPVLEDLPGLLSALSGSDPRAGTPTEDAQQTALATIAAEPYVGRIWCIRVPTSSFVAVRNDKAFPTGNSGFPKSLDVSKAIDKAAGRIGTSTLALKRTLREAHEAGGKTLAQLNEACGFEASGYLRESSSWANVLPPQEKWPAVRDALGLSEQMDSLFASAVREVIGTKTWSSSSHHFAPGADHTERVVLSDTAPATDAAKQWSGWGTALKPAHEPIVLARKPLIGTVAANVLEHGTGALNIDASRVPGEPVPINRLEKWSGFGQEKRPDYEATVNDKGRWPANLILDGSDEVLEHFPYAPGQQAPVKGDEPSESTKNVFGKRKRVAFGTRDGEASANRRYTENGSSNFAALPGERRFDTGSAARFFYCAKPAKKERNLGLAEGASNTHPTVKPVALARYLQKLVTPPGGTTVDMFVGSGSFAVAAVEEGFNFIGMDSDDEDKWLPIARSRVANVLPECRCGLCPQCDRAALDEAAEILGASTPGKESSDCAEFYPTPEGPIEISTAINSGTSPAGGTCPHDEVDATRNPVLEGR